MRGDEGQYILKHRIDDISDEILGDFFFCDGEQSADFIGGQVSDISFFDEFETFIMEFSQRFSASEKSGPVVFSFPFLGVEDNGLLHLPLRL
jgi:hypothetical protein